MVYTLIQPGKKTKKKTTFAIFVTFFLSFTFLFFLFNTNPNPEQ